MIFSEYSWRSLTLALSPSILISPAALLKGTLYPLTLLHYWAHRGQRRRWRPPRSISNFRWFFYFPHTQHFPPEVHDFRIQHLLSLLVTTSTEFPSFIRNECWHRTHIILYSRNFNHQNKCEPSPTLKISLLGVNQFNPLVLFLIFGKPWALWAAQTVIPL